MPVQLNYGGISWRLPKSQKLERIQDEIEKAMKERAPLSITLDGGETLILNSPILSYVTLLDDKGDVSRAPSSLFEYGNWVSSSTTESASVISSRIRDNSVISSEPGSVISSRADPGSVIS